MNSNFTPLRPHPLHMWEHRFAHPDELTFEERVRRFRKCRTWDVRLLYSLYTLRDNEYLMVKYEATWPPQRRKRWKRFTRRFNWFLNPERLITFVTPLEGEEKRHDYKTQRTYYFRRDEKFRLGKHEE